MFPFLIIGGLAVGLFFWASAAMADESNRQIWLIKGKRYAIAHRIVGAGWDASLYPGFCNFSNPVITGAKRTRSGPPSYTEVQFTAEWCIDNYQWDVPDNIEIAEL